MRTSWLVILLATLMLVPFGWAEEKSMECQLGGWEIGALFEDGSQSREFSKSRTPFYDPQDGEKVYRVDVEGADEGCDPELVRVSGGTSCPKEKRSGSSDGNQDFVAVADGKIVAVVREFPPEDMQRYVAALQNRYGHPAGMPDRVSGVIGTFATINERTVWTVDDCGFTVELVQRTTGIGRLVSQRSAVVMTVMVQSDDILD